jgi:hypothetical protein
MMTRLEKRIEEVEGKLKEFVKLLDERESNLEIKKEAYKLLGTINLILHTNKTQSYFDHIRMIRGKDIPIYAKFYERYPLSESVLIIFGILTLSPYTAEEISRKTEIPQEYVLQILEDLMYEGYISPASIEEGKMKYCLDLNEIEIKG